MMNTNFKFIIGLVLVLGFLSCKSNRVALNHLEGSWLLTDNEKNLKYVKIDETKEHNGSILKIAEDSTIIDSYVMNCLFGTGKSKFYSEGTWNIAKNSKYISSTVPINLQGHNFKILKLNDTSFILKNVDKKKTALAQNGHNP
ncbi:hypothetical protein [Maribacter sp. MAR_2009_72]|uniref:hypothetical protein n=1 Tax=Maribacter sp. MAR_2009_72 TaxID=1250050 RepID=UPI00119BA588|nr:hypothetical protein [Maribacter sp. MAR_2009_72]TVZ15644.1 hypothetical protein JM81_1896 [Maribacter sp. MAR_2009_72]